MSSYVRDAVLAAYDHKCQHCPSDNPRKADCVDHIIPMKLKLADIPKLADFDFSTWSTLDSLQNMTASCTPCNIRKSNKLLEIERLTFLLTEAEGRAPFIEYLAGISDLSEIPRNLKHQKIPGTRSHATEFIHACVQGDSASVKKLVTSELPQVVVQKGFEAAVYFAFADVVEAFPDSYLKAHSIEMLLHKLDPTSLRIEHFDILIANGGRCRQRYPDLPLSPLFEALKLANALKAEDDIHCELLERMFKDERATDTQFYLVDAIVRKDYEEASQLLSDAKDEELDLAVPMYCALLSNADIGGSMPFVSLLADHGAPLSEHSYTALVAAIDGGSLPLMERVLETGPSKDILDRAQLFTIETAAWDRFDMAVYALNEAGASPDETTPGFLCALTALVKDPMRRLGQGVYGYSHARLRERGSYFEVLDLLVGTRPLGGAQEILKSVLNHSSAPEYGANTSFQPDWYEDKIVSYLEGKGARLTELGREGFLWACAFGRENTVREFFATTELYNGFHSRLQSRGLLYAARNGYKEIASFLKDQGVQKPRNLPVGPARLAITEFFPTP